MGFGKVRRVSQIFIEQKDDGSIAITLAKVTDELLFSSNKNTMKNFPEQLTNRSKVSKKSSLLLDELTKLDRCGIEQDEGGNIVMTLDEYIEGIKTIEMKNNQRKHIRTRHHSMRTRPIDPCKGA